MSFVPPSARRTFDAAAADARAASRAAEQGSDAKRAPLASLRARDGAAATPAFERRVGRTEVVVSGSRSQGGGFYCADCDSLHKDSNRYLAHINGRAHLKKIGMSTHARRATVEEVLQAFDVERRRMRGEDAPATPPRVVAPPPPADEGERARAAMGLPAAFGSG